MLLIINNQNRFAPKDGGNNGGTNDGGYIWVG